MVLVGAVILHFSFAMTDLGDGILSKVIAIGCAAWVCLYLVDFAWAVGDKYIQGKSKMPNSKL